MFKLFEIKEGKLKVLPTLNSKYIKGFIISSVVILLVSGLSGWLTVDEKQLWKLYNSIIQHFRLTNEIPKIENVEKEIEARTELEVDRAVKEYENLTGDDGSVTIPEPRFIEEEAKPENQTGDAGLLGGPMRLCAPWVDDCPKE